MRFYAYKTRGFANDHVVHVFNSRNARDSWVDDAFGRYAIKRSEVTKHAANWSCTSNCTIRPRPFSGEYWAIVPWDYDTHNPTPEGCLGTIGIGPGYHCEEWKPFYK